MQSISELGSFAAEVIEGDTVAFICWYRDGSLFTANRPFEKVSGYSMEDMNRMRWPDEFTTPETRDSIYRAMDLLDAGQESVHHDETVIRKDGSSLPVDAYVHRYQRVGRAEILYYSFITDISGRRDAEEALARAKDLVDIYLDLMSHDINNMNQIGIGFLEMVVTTLEDKCELDVHDREMLEKALGAMKNSSELINNVRKLQLLTEGDTRLKKMDLGAVLSEVTSRFSKTLDKNITINHRPVTGDFVMSDDLIKDVFSNLVGNAIKHSPKENPLVINIEVTKTREHDTEYYRIAIEDNGPGIRDENKVKIFQRFSRGETKTSGKGLGLYLVKRLVESYDGKVWAEDRVPGDYKKGSRFVVMLPVTEQ